MRRWLYIAAGFGAWALVNLLVICAALRADRAEEAEPRHMPGSSPRCPHEDA